MSTDKDIANLTDSQAAPIAANDADIAVVTILPWWFLLGAAGLVVGLTWMLRAAWWCKWPPGLLAVLAGLLLFYFWTRARNGAISMQRFHARARLPSALILAGACGFAIGDFFPVGGIIIDNACGADVRLFLDNRE